MCSTGSDPPELTIEEDLDLQDVVSSDFSCGLGDDGGRLVRIPSTGATATVEGGLLDFCHRALIPRHHEVTLSHREHSLEKASQCR